MAAAEADGADTFGLQIAEGSLRPQRIRTVDVEAECRERGVDSRDYKQRELVRRSMRKQITSDILNNTAPVFHDPATLPTAGAPSRSTRPALMEKPTNASIETSKRRKLDHKEAKLLIDPLLLQHDMATAKSIQIDTPDSLEEEAANDAKELEGVNAAAKSIQIDTFDSLEDEAADEADGIEGADAAAESIQNLLQGSMDISDDLIDVLMSPHDSPSPLSLITAPAMEFMTYFADINVALGKVLGEDQARFEYTCKNSIHGCPYKNVHPKEIATHEPKCLYDGVYVPPERAHACTQCRSTFKSKEDLATHVKRVHSWIPKKCPKCPAGPVYTEKKVLRKHHESVHAPSSRFRPQKCNFATCKSENIFQTERAFKKHLDGIHHLVRDELRRHIANARAPALDDEEEEE